ncbi:hypothetical protein FA95DRAFT_807141 [Auriscalpium vulgare]|uniref:Uncharacterized protein n=1 Tax=Auriscalpium vulgare TaxID=40419 RepID=A0ACB8RAK2_9AGAM|nr:hypothetical protein FA95DRAFT_807141 [Auriscalpium vulgare]
MSQSAAIAVAVVRCAIRAMATSEARDRGLLDGTISLLRHRRSSFPQLYARRHKAGRLFGSCRAAITSLHSPFDSVMVRHEVARIGPIPRLRTSILASSQPRGELFYRAFPLCIASNRVASTMRLNDAPRRTDSPNLPCFCVADCAKCTTPTTSRHVVLY